MQSNKQLALHNRYYLTFYENINLVRRDSNNSNSLFFLKVLKYKIYKIFSVNLNLTPIILFVFFQYYYYFLDNKNSIY